jgi:hypothetical protein
MLYTVTIRSTTNPSLPKIIKHTSGTFRTQWYLFKVTWYLTIVYRGYRLDEVYLDEDTVEIFDKNTNMSLMVISVEETPKEMDSDLAYGT